VLQGGPSVNGYFHVDGVNLVAQCSHAKIMKTETLRKMAKDAILRARCDARLKEDVSRVAYLQRLDESDIVRIAVANYVQKFQGAPSFGN
jgi:hypothetical protein